MKIDVLLVDQGTVDALFGHVPWLRDRLADQGANHDSAQQQPQWVAGALEGWWELAVDIGAVSAPIGVICNLIASWIWDAHTRHTDGQGSRRATQAVTEVRLILSQGDKVAEVNFTTHDKNMIEDTLKAALIHANFNG